MKTKGIILSTEVTCPRHKMPEYLGNSWCVRIAEYGEEVESALLEMWPRDKKEPDDGVFCLSCVGIWILA